MTREATRASSESIGQFIRWLEMRVASWSHYLMVGIVKPHEHYVFIYDAATENELLQTFGRFAANPELGFTWYDAAILARRVRESSKNL